MVRPMETPSGTECLLTFEENVEKFRSYVRDPEDSVCLFIGHFTTLWHMASGPGEGEGVSLEEASVRLLRALPPRWRSWATAEMRETVIRHPGASVKLDDFTLFATKILYRSITTHNG